MIVCSIPIRTYDINRDGKVSEPRPSTPMQEKYHQKRALRNFNFMKLLIKNKSKEIKIDPTFSEDRSLHNKSSQSHRKSVSEFNPQLTFQEFFHKSKSNKPKHHRNYSLLESRKESIASNLETTPKKGFPERWTKRAKDPKRQDYSRIIEMHTERSAGGCRHLSHISDKARYTERRKPKTAPKGKWRTIFLE